MSEMPKGIISALFPPKAECTTVFVGGINKRAPPELVRGFLEACGPIIDLRTMVEAARRNKTLCGICDFRDPEAAWRAFRILKGFRLGTEALTVRIDKSARRHIVEHLIKVRGRSVSSVLHHPSDELPAPGPEVLAEDQVIKQQLEEMTAGYADCLNVSLPISASIQTPKKIRLSKEQAESDVRDFLLEEIAHFRSSSQIAKAAASVPDIRSKPRSRSPTPKLCPVRRHSGSRHRKLTNHRSHSRSRDRHPTNHRSRSRPHERHSANHRSRSRSLHRHSANQRSRSRSHDRPPVRSLARAHPLLALSTFHLARKFHAEHIRRDERNAEASSRQTQSLCAERRNKRDDDTKHSSSSSAIKRSGRIESKLSSYARPSERRTGSSQPSRNSSDNQRNGRIESKSRSSAHSSGECHRRTRSKPSSSGRKRKTPSDSRTIRHDSASNFAGAASTLRENFSNLGAANFEPRILNFEPQTASEPDSAFFRALQEGPLASKSAGPSPSLGGQGSSLDLSQTSGSFDAMSRLLQDRSDGGSERNSFVQNFEALGSLQPGSMESMLLRLLFEERERKKRQSELIAMLQSVLDGSVKPQPIAVGVERFDSECGVDARKALIDRSTEQSAFKTQDVVFCDDEMEIDNGGTDAEIPRQLPLNLYDPAFVFSREHHHGRASSLGVSRYSSPQDHFDLDLVKNEYWRE